MRVAVIGSGLIGLCTAYELSVRGADVTVLDSASDVANGASYGNGGYLQSSLPDPWNAPGVSKMFINALMNSISGKGDRSAFAAPLSALPSMLRWGLQFLTYANERDFVAGLCANRDLAEYSSEAMKTLLEQQSVSFDQSEMGALIIFRNQEALGRYQNLATQHLSGNTRALTLDASQTIAIEPALGEIGGQLAGAIHLPDDRAGNSRLFCQEIARLIRDRGAQLMLGQSVQTITRSQDKLKIELPETQIAFDKVVIAAGIGSREIAAKIGMKLPIAPAKGYSLSVPMNLLDTAPAHTIVDMDIHAGVNPLGNVLRVAGTAEFCGLRPGVSADRTRYLVDLANQIFPHTTGKINGPQCDPWGGFRPLSVDGIPIIGETPTAGVFINAGHGGLGWTLAAGSGKALAQLICDEPADFDLQRFAADRF